MWSLIVLVFSSKGVCLTLKVIKVRYLKLWMFLSASVTLTFQGHIPIRVRKTPGRWLYNWTFALFVHCNVSILCLIQTLTNLGVLRFMGRNLFCFLESGWLYISIIELKQRGLLPPNYWTVITEPLLNRLYSTGDVCWKLQVQRVFLCFCCCCCLMLIVTGIRPPEPEVALVLKANNLSI